MLFEVWKLFCEKLCQVNKWELLLYDCPSARTSKTTRNHCREKHTFQRIVRKVPWIYFDLFSFIKFNIFLLDVRALENLGSFLANCHNKEKVKYWNFYLNGSIQSCWRMVGCSPWVTLIWFSSLERTKYPTAKIASCLRLFGTLEVKRHAITDRNWEQINSEERLRCTILRSNNAALLMADLRVTNRKKPKLKIIR